MVLVILLLTYPATAKEGHITLLAVKELNDGYEGSTADLYLEIKPGKGRVFLDTFPLTKLDTQMSTRFAKEVACNYLDINCMKYDFIYTIDSNSAIVGGPSAGAAETLLTISLLSDLKIDEKTTITGTINSGGLIGPVGGLKEKIEAGSKIGLKKILIPKGRRFLEESGKIVVENNTQGLTVNYNNTIDLLKYGKERGVEVIEVADLDESISVLSGVTKKETNNVTVDPGYEEVMKGLAIDLCNRTSEFESVLSEFNVSEQLIPSEKTAKNLTKKGEQAFEDHKYYSTASYCFGANVKYNYILLSMQNFTKKELERKVDALLKGISDFDKSISGKQINTITDLESYMVVKERLIEAADYLNQSLNDTNNLYNMAYGMERLYSAYSWYDFSGKPGKKFDLNKKILERSCKEKLSEAEERYQYVSLYLPGWGDSRMDINNAYSDLQENNYEMCLFKASQAKAEANYILNLLGVQEDQLDILINTKLEIIRKNIAEEIKKGIFPILGYSYLEYADSLKESDKLSALLYLEYALELSNLNIYFQEKGETYSIYIDNKIILAFLVGVTSGLIIAIIIRRKRKKRA